MRLLLTLGLLYFTFGINAQTLDQFLSYSFPTNLTASPSGSKLTWVENKEGVRNIWFAVAPDFKGVQLTDYKQDDGQEISDLQFNAAEDKIIFVRGANANRQGEFPNPAIISEGVQQEIRVLDISSKENGFVTEGRSPAISPTKNEIVYLSKGQVWFTNLDDESEPSQMMTTRGSASQLRWSPDGSKLAFTSGRGDHSFIGVFDFASKNLTYLSPSVDQDSDPAWSADGTQVAFIRVPNEKDQLIFEPHRGGLSWSIWVADVETGKGKQLWKADEGAGSVFRGISAANQIFWSADGYIVFPWEKYGWTNLFSVSIENGKINRLTEGNFEVQYVSISKDNKEVIYSSNQGDIDRQHLWKSLAKGGNSTQLTSGDGVEWLPVPLANSGLASLASTGTSPAEAVWWSNGKPKNLSGTLDSYNVKASAPEQVIFKSPDGMEIHGQLFKPDDYDPNKKYPGLLFFHGGSRRQMLLGFHHRLYYHHAFALNQYLANQGYIIMSVNYRSGIGYGMEFREAENYGATGASEVQDVVGAGNYLKSRTDIDAKRLGLWGGSYGGYLTAWGLVREPDMFAAGVDIHGAHDWNVIINNFMPGYNANDRPEFAKLAYESSPIAHVENWKSPVLLIHGDDDRNVPFSESVDLAEALRKQGVEFEQLVFPDEVHGFLLHRNWVDAYKAAADFFERKLK
ncbi:MAG: prolyl oligopeptidase family serine peptidase [Cyclobacteriaceae bacterium]